MSDWKKIEMVYFPDSKLDATLKIDGHAVVVPQGKPVAQPAYADSSFSQSEYLVYREDQCRIRFILKLKFVWFQAEERKLLWLNLDVLD